MLCITMLAVLAPYLHGKMSEWMYMLLTSTVYYCVMALVKGRKPPSLVASVCVVWLHLSV